MQVMKNISRKTAIKRKKYDLTIPSNKWITLGNPAKSIEKYVREVNSVKTFQGGNGAILQKLMIVPIFTDEWKTAEDQKPYLYTELAWLMKKESTPMFFMNKVW